MSAVSNTAAFLKPDASAQQIKIVKAQDIAVKSRREELLKQADYLEAQANRLAKMAREMRRMLATE